jgi:hypothetical protein
MQLKSSILTTLIGISFSLLLAVRAVAQQNTDISAGLKAPANVKIDGKHNEWGTLPAYNKNTTLRYTLANDAENLFLAITCTDQANINKLLAGGLTFTINTEGKKKEKDAAVIVYPMPGRGGARGFRMGGNRGGQGAAAPDTAAIVAAHKQSVAAAKELSITGIKDITDTLVSIYNTYGIKTGITFNTKGSMFYELSIPLKLLQLNINKATELAYNLKLNGIQFGGGNREQVRIGGGDRQGGGGGGFGGGNGGGGNFGGGGGAMMEMMTPTDFWGKYKLAKP